ncbi:hypothetical protein O1611_g1381 [Lasiodiplodia mahajangana]|uniref:Uncharacterized protein n=1 Tax=Lasiodiplodia mahajangana TaxID=1108764 RepID=A0ACC2JY73_9PEZI|nr:hypothetical protein O1611_g1381 [Lasiodiplodia mahajangana]
MEDSNWSILRSGFGITMASRYKCHVLTGSFDWARSDDSSWVANAHQSAGTLKPTPNAYAAADMGSSGTQNPHPEYLYSYDQPYNQPYDAIQDQDIPDHSYNHSTAHPYNSSQQHAIHDDAVPQAYFVPVPNDDTVTWHTVTELNQATAAKPPSKISLWDRFNNGWGPEIFSQICSVLFLLALIILLSRLDGRPLSTWTIAVSPNAFVAVLSIASKASLIYALGQTISQLKWLHLTKKPDSLEDLQHYDDASRGPLGAFRMFWTVRSGHFIAYVGCVVILLALAFEPFSQQLLHFEERVITVPGTQSSVSFSTAYDFQDHGVDGVSASARETIR